MNKINFQKILSTARTEYIKWIINPRMIIIAVLLIFINDFITNPLLGHAVKMNSPLNALEPFIATINSEFLLIIVPSVFLALFSNFPRTDGNSLFFFTEGGENKLVNWSVYLFHIRNHYIYSMPIHRHRIASYI